MGQNGRLGRLGEGLRGPRPSIAARRRNWYKGQRCPGEPVKGLFSDLHTNISHSITADVLFPNWRSLRETMI
jgi:hypothetical protein